MCASLTYKYTGFTVLEALDLFIYPTFNTVFLCVAVLTYAFIFIKYKQSRLPPVPYPAVSRPCEMNAFRIFKRSRFYIPVLLITTYIFFMCVPAFVQTVHVAMGNGHDYDVIINNVLRILWSMSYLMDAIIYIFLKKSVRRLLKLKLFSLLQKTPISGRSERRVSPVLTKETSL